MSPDAQQFKIVYLIIFIFALLQVFPNSLAMRSPQNEVTEVEYQLIMEDSDSGAENTIPKPSSQLELTAEEENELKNGICKIVHNEPNTLTSNAVYKRNEIALNKIEKNMYLFILSESLKDYASELKNQIVTNKVTVTPDESDAVDSALRIHCDLADLKELYNILVSLPDAYEDLNGSGDIDNSTNWERFVAIQLDRVYDYVNTHFNMFKKELLRLKNTKAYYERKNFFRKRDGKAILMTIFYDWLENMVCRPKRIDEHKIREKLNEHLKWVVSLPIE